MLVREVSDLARKYQNPERFFDDVIPKDVQCPYCESKYTINRTDDLHYGSYPAGYDYNELCLKWNCVACGHEAIFTTNHHILLGYEAVTGKKPPVHPFKILFWATIALIASVLAVATLFA